MVCECEKRRDQLDMVLQAGREVGTARHLVAILDLTDCSDHNDGNNDLAREAETRLELV